LGLNRFGPNRFDRFGFNRFNRFRFDRFGRFGGNRLFVNGWGWGGWAGAIPGSAAASEPGAYWMMVASLAGAFEAAPERNPTAVSAVRTSRAWPGVPLPLNTSTAI